MSFLTDAFPADRVRIDSGEERALKQGDRMLGAKCEKKYANRKKGGKRSVQREKCK